MGDRQIAVRTRDEPDTFLCLKTHIYTLWSSQRPVLLGPGALYREIKWRKYESVTHLHLVLIVKNCGVVPPLPYTFAMWKLMKHNEVFTLYQFLYLSETQLYKYTQHTLAYIYIYIHIHIYIYIYIYIYTTYTYLLTPWSRVLLEKLTSKLCS